MTYKTSGFTTETFAGAALSYTSEEIRPWLNTPSAEKTG